MAEHHFERLQCPIDAPLLIVLDNDDLDDDSDDDIIINLQKDVIEKTKETSIPTDKINKSTSKTINTQNRSTNVKRFKRSCYKATDLSSSTDENISTLNFEDNISVLTVSRMGSIYYCLEDLYEKVFASLCSINELITLLERSALVLVRSATLSEKIAIEEKMPKLKSAQSNARYRLLSINAMDHLRKLKTLLLDRHKYQQLDEIINGVKSPPTTNVEKQSIQKTTNKKSKDSMSTKKSNRKKIDEHSKILSSGNISSIQKSKTKKQISSESLTDTTSSTFVREDPSELAQVNSPLQIIHEPETPMPKIVSIEESVPMEPESPIQHSPLVNSKGKVSTDHHCPDSSISKDATESSPSILLQIFRQPIRLYSCNNNQQSHTASRENPLHRVPSNDQQLITAISSKPSEQISSPMNILSAVTDAPVKTVETSSSFRQALIDHKIENVNQLPKLLVRHRKIYAKRTIDTAGQLFPTWLGPPDFRCVHCFTCDQVYTPQKFMVHTDDQQMINEKPTSILPIELLKSERLSSEKVELWNRFCDTLSRFVRAHREKQKMQNDGAIVFA